MRSLKGIKHSNKIKLIENNNITSDLYTISNNLDNIFFITALFIKEGIISKQQNLFHL